MHKPFRPPSQRRCKPDPYEPSAVRGPTFCVPSLQWSCGVWTYRNHGPRMCINGRWLGAQHASKRLYVSRVDQHRELRDPRARLHLRISARLRPDQCPF